MDKKILSFLFSTRLMAVLFVVFAVAMAIGTFVEDRYNTDTARIWIYNTKWFEAIMLIFMLNFFGNIKRYNLFSKEKWSTLLLHLAFILIIAGAFVTRYISYEGMMNIREGATESKFYSDKYFLRISVDGMHEGKMQRRVYEEPTLLSPVSDDYPTISGDFSGKNFDVEITDYILGATETVQPKAGGKTFLKLVEAGDGGRHEHYLKSGEVASIHSLLFALDKPTDGAINIDSKNLTVAMPFDGNFMRMADKMTGSVTKDSVQQLMFRSLYTVGDARFVFPDAPVEGELSFKSDGDFKAKQHTDALMVTVTSQGESKKLVLTGTKGASGEPQSVKIGDQDFTLSFGSKAYDLPFGIKLNDFIASKYPGTEKSYSAYESRITVVDKKPFDTRIYMNHVLDHKGYRFFQASFDPDELGTILSVNHDFWGTWITYVGYFLLFFGMIAVLFSKNSRFGDLRRKLASIEKKKAKLAAMIALFFGLSASAQVTDEHAGHDHAEGHDHEHVVEKPKAAPLTQIDSMIKKYAISEEHAAKFGQLVVQDEGGRMKPVNTFSSELLRKVSKKDTYNGLNSDQVFLSMTQFPMAWFEVPIIFVDPGNDSIRRILGVDKNAKYISFISFFDNEGNYKLSPYLDAAYRAGVPNKFETDFIAADRKVNLLNSALSGGILRIFPIPNDANYKWVSSLELQSAGLKGRDLEFTNNVIPVYLMALREAAEKNDYSRADFYLSGISKYQHKYGGKVMPSDEKVHSEILYNKYDIFKKLYYLYMLTGILMLLFTIINIFAEKKFLRYVIGFFHLVIVFFFLLHTVGLAARWYISGHAPWSDAYESMIYVAWATMLFTLVFGRVHTLFYVFVKNKKQRSDLAVASGAFVASMILMIAHWSWMDPSIANLQPVLDSYWLMIHVAVIVGSYGPFTLGMILGAVSLILMLFVTKKNKAKMQLHIREISYINEMALTVGLVMLTIGNFLGGQWANESWGRYWGWDPKETWALISIMVYAFVIHARFVPGMRSKWLFNVMSVMAFYSIMMTYFGVNFYLTGLHSYASGDKVVTPDFVYWSLAIVLALSTAAWFGHRRLEK